MAAKSSFLLYVRNRRAVDRCQIRVNDPRLRMGRMAQCLAKQPFGGLGVAQRRKQEINGGTGGIDGPIQITPAPLHSNVGLIDAPGLVGRLEMTAQPLFQFGTVALNPAPDCRMVRLQAALSATLQHRGARASTEDTSARRKESIPAPFAAT